VGKRRKLANLHFRAALESQLAVRGLQHLSDIALRHADFHRTISCFVSGERDLGGQPHQVDFVAALDHAASGGDRSRARERGAGRGLAQLVAEDKLCRLFDADHAARNAAIGEALRDAGVRTLVFLPGADIRLDAVGRLCDLFARSALLERWRHVKRFALRGQDHSEEALSTLPSYAGEVGERCPLREQNGGQIIFAHQLASLFLARGALVDCDGLGFSAESAEGGDWRRERFFTFGRLGQRGQRYADTGSEGTGLQKMTARDHEASGEEEPLYRSEMVGRDMRAR
jgi:hypothetical protein